MTRQFRRVGFFIYGEIYEICDVCGGIVCRLRVNGGGSGGDTISAKFGNTVSGAAQAKAPQLVYFEGDGKTGGLLCIGHSLTKHAPAPALGWYSDCGMAASKKENDYVHLLWEKLKKDNPDIPLCIAKGAFFERNFVDADKILPRYKQARDFKPKWIVISLVDNVPQEMAAKHDFIKYYAKLVKYLNPDGAAKMIITTGWYPTSGLNDKLKEFAKQNGITIVDICAIAKKEGMTAKGKFAHHGVASHPSDAGMAALADAYYKALTQR